MSNQFCYRLMPRHFSQLSKIIKEHDYEIPGFHKDLVKVIIKFYEHGITLKEIEGRLSWIIKLIKIDKERMDDPFK